MSTIAYVFLFFSCFHFLFDLNLETLFSRFSSKFKSLNFSDLIFLNLRAIFSRSRTESAGWMTHGALAFFCSCSAEMFAPSFRAAYYFSTMSHSSIGKISLWNFDDFKTIPRTNIYYDKCRCSILAKKKKCRCSKNCVNIDDSR